MAGLLFEHDARFRVTRDLETTALVSWKAPATTDEKCVIPANTILRLFSDVKEPVGQVHYEPIDPPKDEPYVAMVFPEAVNLGLGDVSKQPDTWKRVVWLNADLECAAENHAELEVTLIPESTRTHPKYNGYWFALSVATVGDYLEYLPLTAQALVKQRQPLRVLRSLEVWGLRSDRIAVRCRVPADALLLPRHTVDKPHTVSGWEMTHGDFTWWREDAYIRADEKPNHVRAERICPSHFISGCDPDSIASIDADRDWDALLVPTELVGETIVVT
jgi:hypothetical protein